MLVNVDVDGPGSFVQWLSKKIEQMNQTHTKMLLIFVELKKNENDENTPAWGKCAKQPRCTSDP
jgi:hypothetical protein